MGLQTPSGGLHQHIRAQVWVDVCWLWLGDLERSRPLAEGVDIRIALRKSDDILRNAQSKISVEGYNIEFYPINYQLGSVEYSFSLNFSRPAHPIINQYFNFIQLGFEGYRSVGLGDLSNARLLSRALERSGYYKVLSDIHRKKTDIGKARAKTFGSTDAKVSDFPKCARGVCEGLKTRKHFGQ